MSTCLDFGPVNDPASEPRSGTTATARRGDVTGALRRSPGARSAERSLLMASLFGLALALGIGLVDPVLDTGSSAALHGRAGTIASR